MAEEYNIYMDVDKAKKLKEVAERTIKIIELLEKRYLVNKIVELTGASRQLVEYYEKVLKI